MSLDDKLRYLLKQPGTTVAQIKQAFADDFGFTSTYSGQDVTFSQLAYATGFLTGQEWYDRFKREYHMRADWISSDPTMGADAEHDVLKAARLASGIKGDEIEQ